MAAVLMGLHTRFESDLIGDCSNTVVVSVVLWNVRAVTGAATLDEVLAVETPFVLTADEAKRATG